MKYIYLNNSGIFLIDADKDTPISDIIIRNNSYIDITNVVGFVRLYQAGISEFICEKIVLKPNECFYAGTLTELTELQFIEEIFKAKHRTLFIYPILKYGQFISDSTRESATISCYETSIYKNILLPKSFTVGDCEICIDAKQLPKNDDIIWEAPKKKWVVWN